MWFGGSVRGEGLSGGNLCLSSEGSFDEDWSAATKSPQSSLEGVSGVSGEAVMDKWRERGEC